LRILIRLLGDGDPQNPTVRQRGIRVREELERRGIEAFFWSEDGPESLHADVRSYYDNGPADLVLIQRKPSPKRMAAAKALANVVLVDVNDSIFRTEGSGSPVVGLLTEADALLTPSAWLQKTLRVFHPHVYYWPEAIDTNWLQERVKYSRRKKSVRIAWHGYSDNLCWFGLSPIRWALPELADKYNLTWIISCPAMNSAGKSNEEWARELLPGEVEFYPWCRDELAPLMASCDFAAIPLEQSDWTWSKSCNKSASLMAMGLPVILEETPPHAEVTNDGKVGLLAYQAEDWLDGMAKLITQPNLRKKLGRAGRDYALKHYTVQHVVDMLLSHVETVTAKRR